MAVFQREPPIPPSLAQAAALEAAGTQQYLPSLTRLFNNKGFILLMLTYGMVYCNALLNLTGR